VAADATVAGIGGALLLAYDVALDHRVTFPGGDLQIEQPSYTRPDETDVLASVAGDATRPQLAALVPVVARRRLTRSAMPRGSLFPPLASGSTMAQECS
jgi:hypothetical protein